MAEKIITEVAVADIFDNSDSFFINKNNSLMQILKQDIIFDVENGGTGAKTIEDAKINLNIIDFADEYDASKNYDIGEYCIYDNNLYKKTGNINDEIWNTDDWTITTVAHELNNLFVNDNEYAKLLEDKYDECCLLLTNQYDKYCILLANKYDESKSDNYKIGSYCIRDNVLYRKESVSFNDPNFSDNWKETTVANELSDLTSQHELYGAVRTDNVGFSTSGHIDIEKSWFTHRRDNHINIVTFHIYIAENIEIDTETNLVVYLPISAELSYGVAIRLSDNKVIPVKIDKDSPYLKIMSSNKTQLATNDEIVCTFTYLT